MLGSEDSKVFIRIEILICKWQFISLFSISICNSIYETDITTDNRGGCISYCTFQIPHIKPPPPDLVRIFSSALFSTAINFGTALSQWIRSDYSVHCISVSSCVWGATTSFPGRKLGTPLFAMANPQRSIWG